MFPTEALDMDGTTALDRLLKLAGLGPRETSEATDRTAPYACLGCGATYDVQYHVCPECGGYSVELRQTGLDPDGDPGSRRERR
mgnify:FL=1